MYYNLTEQDRIISALTQYARQEGLPTNGFIPQGFKYNLDTLTVLEGENYSYMIADPTSLYFGPFYQEGARRPRFASLYGNRSRMILLPVSNPIGGKIDESDISDFIESWKNVIRTSADKNDLSVMIIPQGQFTDPFNDSIGEIVSYALENGLTVENADTVATHLQRINAIDSTVSYYGDNARFILSNPTNDKVFGVTYVAWLPLQNGSCQYYSKQARIVRTSPQPGGCNIYASIDIEANQTVTFDIEPSI